MYRAHVRVAGEPDIVPAHVVHPVAAFEVEDPIVVAYQRGVTTTSTPGSPATRTPAQLPGADGLFEPGSTLEEGAENVEAMRRVDDETVVFDFLTDSCRPSTTSGGGPLRGDARDPRLVPARRKTAPSSWTGIAVVAKAFVPGSPAAGFGGSPSPRRRPRSHSPRGRWSEPDHGDEVVREQRRGRRRYWIGCDGAGDSCRGVRQPTWTPAKRRRRTRPGRARLRALALPSGLQLSRCR